MSAGTPSSVMFTEYCPFYDTSTTVAFFAKPTDKIRIQIGIHFNQLQSHKCLIVIGAGLNIFSITFLRKEQSTMIQNQSVAKLRSAMKEPIQLWGKTLLFVRISDLHTKAYFSIVKTLAVDVQVRLGSPFIDRLIRGIFLGERNVVPWHLVPVSFLTRQVFKSKPPLSQLKVTKIASSSYKAIVQIEKQVIIRPYAKTRVIATTPVSSQSLLDPAQLTQQCSHLYIASEIIVTPKYCTSGILIDNFGATKQLLLKRMAEAYTVAAPTVIIDLPYEHVSRTLQEDTNLTYPTLTIAAAHYIPTDNYAGSANDPTKDSKVKGFPTLRPKLATRGQ